MNQHHQRPSPILRVASFAVLRKQGRLYASVRDYGRRYGSPGGMSVLHSDTNINALMDSAWDALFPLLPTGDRLRVNGDSYPDEPRQLARDPKTGHLWG